MIFFLGDYKPLNPFPFLVFFAKESWMEMSRLKYLDTSIILESLFEHAPCHAEAVQIMQAIEHNSESVIISPLNIAEAFHILIEREKLPSNWVESVLQKILSFKGIQLVDLPADLIKSALPFACKYHIDLTDAVNKKLMEQLQITEIYTLDSHFDTFKDLQRLTELTI